MGVSSSPSRPLKVAVSTYDPAVLDWGHCLLLNVPKLEPESKLIPRPKLHTHACRHRSGLHSCVKPVIPHADIITSTHVYGEGVYTPQSGHCSLGGVHSPGCPNLGGWRQHRSAKEQAVEL